MLRPLAAAFALCAAPTLCALAAEQAAEGAPDAPQETVRAFRYAVDWGPAALAQMEIKLTERPSETHFAAEIQSAGLLAFFSDFEAVQTALHGPEGPREFLSHGRYGDDEAARRVRFGDGAPRAETLVASEKDGEPRTPIPEGALTGAVDPVFPILEAMRQVDRGEGCAVKRTVFTGQTAFSMALEDLGMEEIEADRDWTWGGPAAKCRIRIARIGGFLKEGGFWQAEEEDVTREIWFARLSDGAGGGPGAGAEGAEDGIGDGIGVIPVRLRVSWPLGYAIGRIDLR